MGEWGPLVVIGAGLAGSEAAWQPATRGVSVELYEMRPALLTPAHRTGDFAELVCSNSLGSDLPDRAPGLLKRELRRLGSLIMHCADETAVPAGDALAVGREAFAQAVTAVLSAHPLVTVCRQEVTALPALSPGQMTVVATGPLTAPALAAEIAQLAGQEHLYFYDAMAPIVALDSIDQTRTFRGSRFGRGAGDYINCPLTREEYDHFVQELVAAKTIPLRDFEKEDRRFFEACLPVEVLASRGHEALAFGPLKPIGLRDPRTGLRPYAVVQLRQDNLAGTLYNLVGFQTNLLWTEQRRVFGLIPGIEQAEWVRFGQMHRNTFVNSPRLLEPTMRWRGRDDLYLAGQLVGTEGYLGSTASGLVAGLNAARTLQGRPEVCFPASTMIGALMHYVTSSSEVLFQPMKPNLGLLAPLEEAVHKKRARHAACAERSQRDLDALILAEGLL